MIDKSQIKRLATQTGVYVPWHSADADRIIAFAKACYQQGVADTEYRTRYEANALESMNTIGRGEY